MAANARLILTTIPRTFPQGITNCPDSMTIISRNMTMLSNAYDDPHDRSLIDSDDVDDDWIDSILKEADDDLYDDASLLEFAPDDRGDWS